MTYIKSQAMTRHLLNGGGEPALGNSWVVSSPAPYFFIDPFGVVHLGGAIKDGSGNLAAFTLPAIYRPASTVYLPALKGGAVLGYVAIASNGGVAPNVTGEFFLDGITFLAGV